MLLVLMTTGKNSKGFLQDAGPIAMGMMQVATMDTQMNGENAAECSERFSQLLKNKNSKNEELGIIFISTGKSVNDLGNYFLCMSEDTLKYVLVTVASNETSRHFVQMGICVPNQCSQNEMHIFDKLYMQFA